MDEQPRKRLGRPRKVVDIPNAVEEGADASNNDIGNGQVSPVGDSAPANPVRQGEGWSGFVAGVMACKHPGLRNVYHPNPETEIIIRDNGNLNVFVGDIKGQLNTGEFIEI